MEIKQIRKNGNIRIVTIPAKSDMKVGDYVKIIKIKNPEEEEE